MLLEVLSPPTGPAVPLDETRAFLRLSGTGEDALVAGLAAAAETRVESETGLVLTPRRLQRHLAFRRSELHSPGLRLRPGPVRRIEAVVLSTGADLTARMRWTGHRLCLRAGAWLSDLPRDGVVRVIWTAGFAAPPGVPADLRLAINRLAAEGFARRGLPGESGLPARLPADVAAILGHYAEVRL